MRCWQRNDSMNIKCVNKSDGGGVIVIKANTLHTDDDDFELLNIPI